MAHRAQATCAREVSQPHRVRTSADHSPDVRRSRSTSGRRNPATSEPCEDEIPLAASHPTGDTRRTSSGASSTSAALPTFATTTSNAPSISASGAGVASTRPSMPLSAALRRVASIGLRLHVGRDHARRPESQRGQSEHAAAAPDVEHALPAPDPLHQQLDQQPRRRMLATSETPRAELDQPRQVSAVVLGPRKAHAEPLPEHDRAGVAHPLLRGGRRRRVGSPPICLRRGGSTRGGVPPTRRPRLRAPAAGPRSVPRPAPCPRPAHQGCAAPTRVRPRWWRPRRSPCQAPTNTIRRDATGPHPRRRHHRQGEST